jgi:hypothetical protein
MEEFMINPNQQLVRDFYELAFDQHRPREAATELRLTRRPKNNPPGGARML